MPFLTKCFNIILFVFILNTPVFAQTEAIASVSDNSVVKGDLFRLTVTVNDTGSQYRVDTSALENNFKVSSPSRQQETIYDNGDWKKRLTWSYTLQATKTGTFVIPPLKIGDVSTQAIEIKVSDAKPADYSTTDDAIFIENTINKSNTYINQPAILESKIYVSGRFTNGQIQPPQLDGAEIEQISGNNSNIVKNGIRYELYTYQYKITPSTSGELNIDSPILTGSVYKTLRANSFQQRMASVPVNIRGNNISLKVNEMPAEYQPGWLISEDVRLKENNNLQEKEHFVGEPITRSISLQAASVDLEKMPEIKLNYDNSIRYYPDKDELTQGRANNTIYSQRTITHAIIADKSGPLVLPEIKISWWNSQTQQQEVATLPAQTIMIKPSTTSVETTQPTQQTSVTPTTQNNSVAVEKEAVNTTVKESSPSQVMPWKISTLVLLCLLILMIIYHLYTRKASRSIGVKTQPAVTNKPYQDLLKVLKQENPQQTYLALLVYFQSQQPNITHLQQIADYTNLDESKKQALLENLMQLELACSNSAHKWSAKALSKLIILHHKITKSATSPAVNNINP